jgi:host factor-I protein
MISSAMAITPSKTTKLTLSRAAKAAASMAADGASPESDPKGPSKAATAALPDAAPARQAKGEKEKMPSESRQNLQDVFLNHIRKNKAPVTVFLVNGVKLQGVVTWFDNFSVLLRRDGHSQLVYKHAISTIMPLSPIQLFEQDKDGGAPVEA